MIHNSLVFLRSYFDYNLIGVLNFTAFALSISVGLLVLSRNPTSRINRSFFLITLTGGIWLFCFSLLHSVHDTNDGYLWLRLSYLLAVPFISPFVYLFTSYWTDTPPSKKTTWLIFLTASAFALTMFFFAPSICDYQYLRFGRFTHYKSDTFGRLYFVFILAFFYYVAHLSFLKSFRAWKNAQTPSQKLQYRQFLIGFVVGYTGSIDFLVSAGLPFFHFGFISFSAFVLIIAYSIFRHQFLDVNLIVKRLSMIVCIYAFLFAILLPIAAPIFHHYFSQTSTNASVSLLLLSSVAFGTVLSTGPFIYAYLVRHTFWLKDKVTTGLAHELKSPLGAIQGAVDVLLATLESPNTDREKILSYAHMIRNNGNRLESFVKDLLHVAKIQDGNVTLMKTAISPMDVIARVADANRPLLETKGLTLNVRGEKDSQLFADAEKFEQIVSNLMSNAIKFTDKGEIFVNIERTNGHVRCSVVDQGAGIPTADLEKIFERFYQGRKTTKGSGIGLTIAKAWVEAHGGKIWADSAGEGRGTTVTFTLPAHA